MLLSIDGFHTTVQSTQWRRKKFALGCTNGRIVENVVVGGKRPKLKV